MASTNTPGITTSCLFIDWEETTFFTWTITLPPEAFTAIATSKESIIEDSSSILILPNSSALVPLIIPIS